MVLVSGLGVGENEECQAQSQAAQEHTATSSQMVLLALTEAPYFSGNAEH